SARAVTARPGLSGWRDEDQAETANQDRRPDAARKPHLRSGDVALAMPFRQRRVGAGVGEGLSLIQVQPPVDDLSLAKGHLVGVSQLDVHLAEAALAGGPRPDKGDHPVPDGDRLEVLHLHHPESIHDLTDYPAHSRVPSGRAGLPEVGVVDLDVLVEVLQRPLEAPVVEGLDQALEDLDVGVRHPAILLDLTDSILCATETGSQRQTHRLGGKATRWNRHDISKSEAHRFLYIHA